MAFLEQQVNVIFNNRDVARYKVGGTITNGVRVLDGVLSLHHKNGDYAPLTHVISIPLHNIRSWKVED
jgi:hypothetical protein